MLIDLHTHSNCSDGTLTPAELVHRAAAAGVHVLALTDHDSIAGLGEAQAAADECHITLVPGVELSASWRAQGVHVLGLWIDPHAADFNAHLAAQSELRHERMRKICLRLAKLGLPGEKLLTTVQAFPGVPTRSHLAHALVAVGAVDSPDAAFRKYLSKGKAAHIAADWPPLEEVVAVDRRGRGCGRARSSGALFPVLRGAPHAGERLRRGRRRRLGSDHRRQRRPACRGLHLTGHDPWAARLGRLGLP